ncbi:MAG: EAL domain-containing protein [Actinomycetota bacterium]|nr:EAL domain-containing protein [Actinomycetota bacterium]
MRAWHVYLVLGLLATGAYFLLPSPAAQDITRPLFNISALVAFAIGILIHRPKRPLPWYLFTLGMVLFVCGIATYVYYEATLGTTPSISVADVFFIASYPCAAAALLLIQSRRLVRDRASTIDPLIIAVGVGMLAWVFLMRPYAEAPSLTLLERLVFMAYPLMDVLLLAVVVRMLLVPGRHPFSYYPLVAGLVCTLSFDAAYGVSNAAGTYQTGSPIDALELLFLVLFGTAALHPSMVELSDQTVLHPETKLTRRRLVLLAAASLMAPGMLALQAARGEPLSIPVVVGGSVVLFLLVLIRMAGIMQNRERAIDQEKLLRRTAADLVAAPDRENIYQVALDTTRALVGEMPRTWVGIATGSLEDVTLVAATGGQGSEVAGARIYLDEYPDSVHAGLLEGRIIQVEHLNITNGSKLEDMGFEPDTQAVFFVPLLVQTRLRGAIIILTDYSSLPEDSKVTLEALGREVALALESAALAEEVHRRKSEERFRALIQNSSDVVAVVGADGVTQYISPAVERVLGYRPEDGIGRNIFTPAMMHPEDIDKVREAFGGLIGSPGASATLDFRLRHIDGRWAYVEATAKNLLYDPSVGGVVVNYRDVTERKIFEDRLRHQAFHDSLTELPNRAHFMDQLEHALVRVEGRQRTTAVLFLDLDNFKLVNDSLGHEAGDTLLALVARRLQRAVRTRNTAARFGGDEFTILLEDIKDEKEAVRVASQITRALEAPFVLEGREVFVTTSIGIALGTSGCERPTDLLRNADVALYHAKASGKATYAVFDIAMNLLALDRLNLEVDLRRAIERREFDVYYQPQVNLSTGTVEGWEALVRWMHPERGPIPPAAFLPVAEETGLIVQIGSLVLEEACRQAKEWQDLHLADTPLKMSVNISARQLQRSDELGRESVRVLEKTGLDPGSLVLELTESMIMEHAEHSIDVLGSLKDLGVLVAVDDFGTGYSSLAYLKRFPVDILKVDKSFIDGLVENVEDAAIVGAVLSLARALGMSTVAEGIETTGQLERIGALGCDVGQGYYFSEPLPAQEASTLLPAPAGLRA